MVFIGHLGSVDQSPEKASLAQLVEQHIRNVQVAGSSPARGSAFFWDKQQVTGSNPIEDFFIIF
jgi:hypothetical protein